MYVLLRINGKKTSVEMAGDAGCLADLSQEADAARSGHT